MEESILTSIKKLIGAGDEDCDQFDVDIIMHINGAFSHLYSIGVGPSSGFRIQDSTSVWTDYMEDGPSLDLVKDYIYLKVKLIFDPPTSGTLIDSINKQINEKEFLLNIAEDRPATT